MMGFGESLRIWNCFIVAELQRFYKYLCPTLSIQRLWCLSRNWEEYLGTTGKGYLCLMCVEAKVTTTRRAGTQVIWKVSLYTPPTAIPHPHYTNHLSLTTTRTLTASLPITHGTRLWSFTHFVSCFLHIQTSSYYATQRLSPPPLLTALQAPYHLRQIPSAPAGRRAGQNMYLPRWDERYRLLITWR